MRVPASFHGAALAAGKYLNWVLHRLHQRWARVNLRIDQAEENATGIGINADGCLIRNGGIKHRCPISFAETGARRRWSAPPRRQPMLFVGQVNVIPPAVDSEMAGGVRATTPVTSTTEIGPRTV